jgi:putative ABC transport system permease protein
MAVARHQFRAGLFARRVSAARRTPTSRPSPTRTARRVGREIALLKARPREFPTVTAVRVREALEAVAKVVLDLTFAIRGASAITLIAAVLVLAGALATGHRHRVYDAVVLKMLGATRCRLLGAYALEYLLIGLATAVVGVAAGSLAAFW